jgi:hypothetical protein
LVKKAADIAVEPQLKKFHKLTTVLFLASLGH